jgi:hypothetical protein
MFALWQERVILPLEYKPRAKTIFYFFIKNRKNKMEKQNKTNIEREDILVVEDQKMPLDRISYAIRRGILGEERPLTLSKDSGKYLEDRGIDVAKCYNEATGFISEKKYGLIFLDHRLPYESQGDLEKTDIHSFSSSLRNIGYSLIPSIRERNPQAVIIGTSSLGENDLSKFPKPDYCLDKSSADIEGDLVSILNKVGRSVGK